MIKNSLLERRSLAEQVAAHIKGMILSGTLKTGQRIPEESLAAEFAISRTPIREALRQLEHYGLVEIKPRTYARVAEISLDEARQVAEVRTQLEELSVRTLAGKVTEEDIRELSALAHECAARAGAEDVAAVFEADSRFHLEIAARTGNAYLLDMLEQLDAKVMLYRLTFCTSLEKVAGDVSVHDEIVAALAAYDADKAAGLMVAHTRKMGQTVS